MKEYRDNCQRAKVATKFNEYDDEYLKIINKLKTNHINCFKYNYNLDFELQKHLSF